MFSALGNFLGRHSGKVLIAAIAFLILAGAVGTNVFGRLTTGGLANDSSESAQVLKTVEQEFGTYNASMMVLFESKNGQTVTDPQFQQAVESALHEIEPETNSITTYYNTGAEDFVSQDKKSTFAAVALKEETAHLALEHAREINSDIVDIKVGGETALNADINEQIERDLATAETISFIVLAVLLVIVFRSFVSGMLPLVLGIFSVLGAFLMTWLLTQVTDVSRYAINIIILLGLGLSIDYSLFIVSRFREELRTGKKVTEALTRTVETAGRTVFFSGLTVIISLLGLLIFPLDFLQSMSLGGSAAVFVAMLAALVVLPAILRKLGARVNSLSFGSARRDRQALKNGQTVAEKQSFWYKSGQLFMKRYWLAIALTLIPLVIVGLPFLRAHFSSPDYRSLPDGSEARIVSERLTNDFGSQTSPIKVIVHTDGEAESPDNISKLYDYTRELEKLEGVTSVDSIVTQQPSFNKQMYQDLYAQADESPEIQALLERRVAGNLTVIDVNYKGSADDTATQQLVERVRATAAPTGTTVQVGGAAAELHDLLATLGQYIPYGLAIIVVALFILLFLMLGSIIIPLKAILMNILSLSAAFGALVWIFQDGNWASVFNLTPTGGIDATMPVLIFAIAFGLSMDYSVFLYSRIKEQYDKNGHNNEEAVLSGLQKTGSIITSAAVLLFVVVVAFATARIPLMQQVGVGLALTVLIDAFIVRMILVPATMKLLNKANWWAPKPLRRIQERLGLGEKE